MNKEKNKTTQVVREAMRIVSQDVMPPKVVREGVVKPEMDYDNWPSSVPHLTVGELSKRLVICEAKVLEQTEQIALISEFIRKSKSKKKHG